MADVCDDCGRPVTVCGPEEDWTECNRLASLRRGQCPGCNRNWATRSAFDAQRARADRAEATVERLLDDADRRAWAACVRDAGCWLGQWLPSDDPDCYGPANALAQLAHALRTAAKAGP